MSGLELHSTAVFDEAFGIRSPKRRPTTSCPVASVARDDYFREFEALCSDPHGEQVVLLANGHPGSAIGFRLVVVGRRSGFEVDHAVAAVGPEDRD